MLISSARSINLRLFVAVILHVSGCAAFKPEMRYQDLIKEHRSTQSESRNELDISLEEFVSPEKSRKVFDADIATYGVLAIFVLANNKSTASYRVWGMEAKAFSAEQPLGFLRGVDAADQAATRDAAGKAAAWTVAMGPFALLFWPIAISGSGSHTSYVNRDIENHFNSLELGNLQLRPSQIAGGFLYFKLPDGIKNPVSITIEIPISVEGSENRSSFKFNLSLRHSQGTR